MAKLVYNFMSLDYDESLKFINHQGKNVLKIKF